MPGPRPRPTIVKIREGEKNKDRINLREPKPRPTVPKMPKHLGKVARKEYRRMAKILERCGVLSEIDGSALAAYAQSFATWMEAQELVNEKGILVKYGEAKMPRQNPALIIARDARKEMMRILVEFGMTPSSRSKIVVNPKKANTKMESLID